MGEEAITEFAPAKVNLTLRVGPPRLDGYHPLDSLVAFADWGDTIRVRPASGLLLSMNGPFADRLGGGDNLVLRAAVVLQKAAGRFEGASIELHKALPVEAGLGGGSADAAATLRALNRLWNLGFTEEGLARIAIDIGSDVPACVWSRTLRMRGRGEQIDLVGGPLDWPAVIVNPGAPLSTGSVFAAYDKMHADPLRAAEAQPDFETWIAREGNDLEAVAIARQPLVGEALDMIEAHPGCRLARMSGSGASCFGLFDTQDQAETAARRIGEARPDWLSRAVILGPST